MDEKSGKSRQTTSGIAVAIAATIMLGTILYILGVGPAYVMAHKGILSEQVFETAYRPAITACSK